MGLRIVYLFYQHDNHDDIIALARDLASLYYSDFGYVLVDRYTNVSQCNPQVHMHVHVHSSE